MKASNTKMYHITSLTMKLLFGLLVVACLLPMKASAQQGTINQFVLCVDALPAGATAADAVACVPDTGCYFTNTMSQESGQPACKLRDGTRLPRVIFSCTGPNASETLRFRPAFDLCTQNNLVNHIELGQDVRRNTTDDPGFAGYGIQYMADVDMGLAPAQFTLFLPTPTADKRIGVIDASSPPNTKGCAECHDRFRPVSTSMGSFNTFGPIPPALADGTISTNDPLVTAPATSVSLSTICSGIAASTQLANTPAKKALALSLCNNLVGKEH